MWKNEPPPLFELPLFDDLVGEVYDTHQLVSLVRTDGDPGNPKVGVEEVLPVVSTSHPIVHNKLDDYRAGADGTERDPLPTQCLRCPISAYPIRPL